MNLYDKMELKKKQTRSLSQKSSDVNGTPFFMNKLIWKFHSKLIN